MNTNTWKEWSVGLSGVIGFVAPVIYAWDIYQKNMEQSIATWSMALLLNTIALIMVYRGGNKRPLLQVGWTAASVCIFVAVCLSQSPFRFGWVETVSLACCAVAVWVWRTKDARSGLPFYMVAAYVSFIPQVSDFWFKPQPETLYVWLWAIVGCTFAIIGAKERNFVSTFVPYGCGALNAIVAAVLIFR